MPKPAHLPSIPVIGEAVQSGRSGPENAARPVRRRARPTGAK
jgi:hypothetical protein